MTKISENVWKIVVVVLALLVVAPLHAQSYQQLAVFDGTNGQDPRASVIQGADGNFYGTTKSGGIGDCPGQCGVIFKMTPAGELTTLYEFCKKGGSCPDGQNPIAALLLGKNGDFYGTTFGGGTIPEGDSGVASGTVFRMTPEGKVHTMYTFCKTWPCPDGAGPSSALIQGTNGNFYGTTYGGGANGLGTIFEITPEGALTTLYSFCSQGGPDVCSDGGYPTAGLVQASDGNFYGVTGKGGICLQDPCYPYDNGGTIFQLTAGGQYTVLYSFCSQPNCADGANPSTSLIQGTDGNLYGTTYDGGSDVAGTTFKISLSGQFTQLDGSGFFYPNGLIQGTDGNFYGTEANDGTDNSGAVFQMTPTGALTLEYSFCNCGADGGAPAAAVFQATNGTFYGTTSAGTGTSGDGTVYSVSMGLVPFVEAVPAVGEVGNKITILGTELAGVSSVTFNGISATFTQESDTEIIAKVPKKATTGPIEVVVPSGTLSSNVVFQVIK